MINSTTITLFQESNQSLSQQLFDLSGIQTITETEESFPELTYFFQQMNCNQNKIEFTLSLAEVEKEVEEILRRLKSKKPSDSFEANKIIEEVWASLRSFKNAINKIIEETKMKIKLSKKKLELFFTKNSFEEIMKKTMREIFDSLHIKNTEIIKSVQNKIKGKINSELFNVLIELKLEEIFHCFIKDYKMIFTETICIDLTEKFDTLSDIKRKRNKILKRLKMNESDESISLTADEGMMEIEEEVSPI